MSRPRPNRMRVSRNQNTNRRFLSLSRSDFSYYVTKFVGAGYYIKPLPLWDPYLDDFTPLYEQVSEEDSTDIEVGDWIRPYPCVKLSQGNNTVRYIPYDLATSDFSKINRNPVVLLRDAIMSAQANGMAPDTWSGLFKNRFDKNSRQNQNAYIGFDQSVYFTVCAILESSGDIHNPPLGSTKEGNFILFQMAKSAGEGLREAVFGNYDKNFLDPDNNSVIRIVPSQGGQTSGGSYSPSRYKIYIEEFNKFPVSVSGAVEKIAQSKIGWDTFLKIPSIEEQIQYLISSTLPPSAIIFALGDSEYRDLIPMKYRDMALRLLDQELAQPRSGNEDSVMNMPNYNTPNQSQYQQPQYQPPTGSYNQYTDRQNYSQFQHQPPHTPNPDLGNPGVEAPEEGMPDRQPTPEEAMKQTPKQDAKDTLARARARFSRGAQQPE